jgi:long-subunit acyl-CoA synthetase (AMP-forming)
VNYLMLGAKGNYFADDEICEVFYDLDVEPKDTIHSLGDTATDWSISDFAEVEWGCRVVMHPILKNISEKQRGALMLLEESEPDFVVLFVDDIRKQPLMQRVLQLARGNNVPGRIVTRQPREEEAQLMEVSA